MIRNGSFQDDALMVRARYAWETSKPREGNPGRLRGPSRGTRLARYHHISR
jgi:hypothetical protein